MIIQRSDQEFLGKQQIRMAYHTVYVYCNILPAMKEKESVISFILRHIFIGSKREKIYIWRLIERVRLDNELINIVKSSVNFF